MICSLRPVNLVWTQEENIDIGMGRQIAPAVAADRYQRETVGRGRIRLWIEDLCCPLEQNAQDSIDQSGLAGDDFRTRRPRIEAPAKLPAAVVEGTPQELERALPVIWPKPGDLVRESSSAA